VFLALSLSLSLSPGLTLTYAVTQDSVRPETELRSEDRDPCRLPGLGLERRLLSLYDVPYSSRTLRTYRIIMVYGMGCGVGMW